ncbi:unnamed protein product [Phytomonas sp. EM1]|nr:unnamed protein product [Phytomonas sp. EM1]|eukprot:CCW61090.1 unnamed protein product [Phytomonas sp. isolate EM1]
MPSTTQARVSAPFNLAAPNPSQVLRPGWLSELPGLSKAPSAPSPSPPSDDEALTQTARPSSSDSPSSDYYYYYYSSSHSSSSFTKSSSSSSEDRSSSGNITQRPPLAKVILNAPPPLTPAGNSNTNSNRTKAPSPPASTRTLRAPYFAPDSNVIVRVRPRPSRDSTRELNAPHAAFSEYEIRPRESPFAVVSLPSSQDCNLASNSEVFRVRNTSSTSGIAVWANFLDGRRFFPPRDDKGDPHTREGPSPATKIKTKQVGGGIHGGSLVKGVSPTLSSKPSSSTCSCCTCSCGGGGANCSCSCSCSGSCCSCSFSCSCGDSASESRETDTSFSSTTTTSSSKRITRKESKQPLPHPIDLPPVPKLLRLPLFPTQEGTATESPLEAREPPVEARGTKPTEPTTTMRDECLQTTPEEAPIDLENAKPLEEAVSAPPSREISDADVKTPPPSEDRGLSAMLLRLSTAYEGWFEQRERTLDDAFAQLRELLISECPQPPPALDEPEGREDRKDSQKILEAPRLILYATEWEPPRVVRVDRASSPIVEGANPMGCKAVQTTVSSAEEEARVAEFLHRAQISMADTFSSALRALEEGEAWQRRVLTEMEADFREEALNARHREALRATATANHRLSLAQNDFSARLLSQEWRHLLQLHAIEAERQRRLTVESEETAARGALLAGVHETIVETQRRASACELQKAAQRQLELTEESSRLRFWQLEAIERERALRVQLLHALRMPTVTIVAPPGKSVKTAEDARGEGGDTCGFIRQHQGGFGKDIERIEERDLAVHLRFARAHQEAVRAVRAQQRCV